MRMLCGSAEQEGATSLSPEVQLARALGKDGQLAIQMFTAALNDSALHKAPGDLMAFGRYVIPVFFAHQFDPQKVDIKRCVYRC